MSNFKVIVPLAFGVVVGACQRSPQQTVSSPAASQIERPVVANEHDSITLHFAVATLASNSRDTISVVMDRSGQIHYPTVVLAGLGHRKRVTLRLEMDWLPNLVAFGDLDGNGWRDIVMLSESESSSLAQVVLVSSDSMWQPSTTPVDLWQRNQFIRTTHDLSRSCEEAVLPKIIRDTSERDLLGISAGSQREGRDCGPIRQVLLTVRNGSLQQVK